MAAELAKIDQAQQIDLPKTNKRGGAITPLTIYISYFTDLLAAIGRGNLSPQLYRELRKKSAALLDAAQSLQVSLTSNHE